MIIRKKYKKPVEPEVEAIIISLSPEEFHDLRSVAMRELERYGPLDQLKSHKVHTLRQLLSNPGVMLEEV